MPLLTPEQLANVSQHDAILLCGWPGSGKSTLAKELQDALQATYLSSDSLRQRLFQSDRYGEEGHQQVQQWSSRVYELMYEEAIQEVQSGHKVVIDATHLHTEKRMANLAILLAVLQPSQVCYLIMNTPPKFIAERMLSLPDLAEGWQKVTNFFLADQEKGNISWPTLERENVAVYEVYTR